MDFAPSVVERQLALVYLDGIFVFFCTAAEKRDHLEDVSTLLHDAGVTLNLKKWNFFNEIIEYLAHAVCIRRLEIASPTMDAIEGLQALRNVTELIFVLGFCKVLIQLVPKFVRDASPRSDKLRKGHPFNLERYEKELNAKKMFKEKVISPPIRCHHKPRGTETGHRCLLRSTRMCISGGTTWQNG